MAKRYRWTHSKPLGRPNVAMQGNILLPAPDPQKNFIRQGDVFVPTEAELKAFGDRISEITGEEATK